MTATRLWPDIIVGWERNTRYVVAEGVSRERAKHLVAYDVGEAYIDMRCVRVWLHEREVAEDESADLWLEEWYPGYRCWLGCACEAEDAESFWEVTWKS